MRRRGSVAALAVAVLSVLGGVSTTVFATQQAAPAAAVAGQVRFTAAGDFAANADTDRVLDTISTVGPDLNLALGDLSYGVTGQEQAWCDRVTSKVRSGFPFELIAGNHESNGLNGNINDFSSCLPNQLPGLVGTYGRQWYADVPQADPLVRFIGISPDLTFPDGTWSYAAGTPRYAWTAAAIDGARAAGVKWVVVGLHKPCLSMGEYDCANNTDIYNLLLAKKVDLVLNGHEHLYQRTHQLAVSGSCPALVPGQYNPACVVDSDSTMLRGAGTVMATVGTGGQIPYDASPSDPEAPYFAAYAGAGQGAPHGVLSVTATTTSLDAAFVPAAGSTYTDAFTVRDPLPGENLPPTAAFTSTCTNLLCTLDGSGSTDPEGPIQSYAWDFGDGATATGATTPHTYAAAGTFTVRLTVLDGEGAPGTTSRALTVTAQPPVTRVAADSFTRTVTGGWGTADSGGPWTLSGDLTSFSVNGSAGLVRLAVGAGPTAILKQVSTTSVSLTGTVSLDKRPTGTAVGIWVLGRWVPNAGNYRAQVRVGTSGDVSVALARFSPSAQVTLQPAAVVPGLAFTPGTPLAVRVEVTGTSPTTVRARVWQQGSPEPSTWVRSVTDSTAGFQVAGGVGFAPSLAAGRRTRRSLLVDDLVVAASTGGHRG